MGSISITDAGAPAAPQTGARSEQRVRAAALECFARWGLTKTTIDDIAGAAGVSRATVYRHFPGGKDTVVEAVLGQEVHRFFSDLAGELARHDEPDALLVAGVGRALRFLTEHPALRAVLANEPGLLLPQVAFHRLGPLLEAAAAFAAPYLRPHLPGSEVGAPAGPDRATEVAELLVRVVLSYALEPSDHLDPTDPRSVERLVRAHLLPAMRAASPLRTPSPSQEPATP
jgi:AcrR family transcriptional regulator